MRKTIGVRKKLELTITELVLFIKRDVLEEELTLHILCRENFNKKKLPFSVNVRTFII